MFEKQFRDIDDTLRKDAGCSTELDYIEQTSWVLFLKYLSDYERAEMERSQFDNRTYEPILKKEFSWDFWAAPKKEDGRLNHNLAKKGDDLKDFVENELFPYLRKFKTDAENADTIEYKIGEIFNELKNKFQSGYILREVVDKIDEMRFSSVEERHDLSALYEDKIKNMGNAGRNGGEYYTPRPLIKAIIEVVAPQIGETIYDGACGSAGFLCEAYDYLRKSHNQLTTKDLELLQKKTFYGVEKKSLAYVIGIMNMILHGIEAPNIIHKNTLTQDIRNIQESDRVDVVLANPPFGGKERSEIRSNFPIDTGETAYLFLQHFIKKLKAGGRCGVVIKNTFLSNTDNASIALRKELLQTCDLHTVLDFPQTPFTGTGVKTVVLFFTKGKPTERVWYYQMDPQRKFGKTTPLQEKHLQDFITLAKTKADSENSWTLDIGQVEKITWDLTVRNPRPAEKKDTRTPGEILAKVEKLDKVTTQSMERIKELLGVEFNGD